MIAALALFALLAGQDVNQTIKIGSVDYFGQTGVDIAPIVKAIPIHEGDGLTPDQLQAKMQQLAATVRKELGKPATDMAIVGYDPQGRMMLFVGIPGPTVKQAKYRELPGSKLELDAEGLNLYKDFTKRLMPAIQSGHAGEDDSKGYSLSEDRELRAIQLKMREYALGHSKEIFAAVDSRQEEQRIAAAHLLGYAEQSKEQVARLVEATRDPNETVRNNAVRALGVLIRSGSKPAAAVDPGRFIEMVCSGTWTDRNKGGFVLEELSQSRNPGLLARIRKEALPSLIEMARWKSSGHAYSARFILGRVAGIEEKRLTELVVAGKADEIVSAVSRS